MASGPGAVLGMGCSRLGSLLADGGRAEAEDAVRAALDEGITVFDTANIYGQGSSELILGGVLPNRGVEICTKAGFVAPAPLWALRLAKVVMRQAMPRFSQLRGQMADRRSRSFAQRFDVVHLSRALDGSLRRLRRPRVEMFLLHNPPPAAAECEELWKWVDEEHSRGRIGAFGISCAGEAADRVWLDHLQITVAQIPARSVLPGPGPLLSDPRASRLRLLVRELIGTGQHGPAAIEERLRAAAATAVSVALLGMTSSCHVRHAAGIFRAAARSRPPVVSAMAQL